MVYSLFLDLVNSLLAIVKELGYIGILIGMAIESSFIPFPSEIVLVPAGALVAKGELNFFLVFLAGLLGSLIGAWVNFFLAWFLGRNTVELLVDRYGKFLFINRKKLERTDNYFKKHGEITIFVSRLIPVVRQLISLPAGFAKMNFIKFTLFTALGAGIWTVLLIGVGFFFGSNVGSVLKIATTIALILVAAIILFYLMVRKEKSN